jgi:predicted CopG family antitoxin
MYKNDAWELSLNDDEKIKAWVEHYTRLLHVEFEWSSDLLPEAAPVEGPSPPVILDIICKALHKMKRGKTAVPSEVIAEILKLSGEEGITMLMHLTEKAFSEGVTPRHWKESCIINLYRDKGDALDQISYQGLKLTDQLG